MIKYTSRIETWMHPISMVPKLPEENPAVTTWMIGMKLPTCSWQDAWNLMFLEVVVHLQIQRSGLHKIQLHWCLQFVETPLDQHSPVNFNVIHQYMLIKLCLLPRFMRLMKFRNLLTITDRIYLLWNRSWNPALGRVWRFSMHSCKSKFDLLQLWCFIILNTMQSWLLHILESLLFLEWYQHLFLEAFAMQIWTLSGVPPLPAILFDVN